MTTVAPPLGRLKAVWEYLSIDQIAESLGWRSPVVTYPAPSVSTLRYARLIKPQPLCHWHGLAFF